LKAKQDEIEELEDVLRDKNQVIEGLEKTLSQKAPKVEKPKPFVPTPPPPKPAGKYKAVKGDEVDELLAQYINDWNITLPIRRLGDGYYLFGTKKIYAKVMNNKLVVRVGGGYMSF